jgi:biphenyl-2,3-diol 1,2-dioxygenase
MSAVSRLGYLGLSVSDLAAWERLAGEILGLELAERKPDGSLALRLDEYQQRIVLVPDGKDDVAFVGWEVPDEAELLALCDLLKAAGVAVADGSEEDARARCVRRLIRFADPSGLICEVFYGPLVRFERPFRSPRAMSGFVTGEQGLGHVVLAVKDADRSLHFYCDVLGLRVSDFVKMRVAPEVSIDITFLHANPRHHSLAFVEVPLPKRLHHLMLEVRSLDDVGRAYDLCLERGVEIAQTLGRHTNDHMVSFYLRTPSGFLVEYGWGARSVDDRTWQVMSYESGSIWGHRSPRP